jgi:hypothetical protein
VPTNHRSTALGRNKLRIFANRICGKNAEEQASPFRLRIDRTGLGRRSDLISVARPVIANPDLYQILERQEKPDNPCTFCNKCDMPTSLFPVGCYDIDRFDGNYERMERGSRFYGKTKEGEFMSELEALDGGYSPAGGTGQ